MSHKKIISGVKLPTAEIVSWLLCLRFWRDAFFADGVSLKFLTLRRRERMCLIYWEGTLGTAGRGVHPKRELGSIREPK